MPSTQEITLRAGIKVPAYVPPSKQTRKRKAPNKGSGPPQQPPNTLPDAEAAALAAQLEQVRA